jgi:hypothetical protein
LSGAYARGGQPRATPDPDERAYAEMIRWQRMYNARQAAEEARRASDRTEGNPRPPAEDYWRTHPDLGESLIPVWGSAREAIADAYEGDVLGAGLNGALAASDLFLAGAVVRSLGKGALKVGGSHAWKGGSGVRAWMGKHKYLAPNQHGHHWAIPQNRWGKHVPDVIKNQPWNVKPMKDPAIHMRMDRSWGGKPPLTPLERYWHGTPAWAKVGSGASIGHPAGAGKAAMDEDR